jgi:hypothetical protein
VDALISGQGIVLSILAGLFITVLILIQGFWVLGVNVVILALGARIAGVVFKGVTTMMAGSDVVFGDGSDIAMHFIHALLGPLCSLAAFQ